MTQPPTTIPDLVEVGLAKNTTGVACATKRGGAWIETSVDDFRAKIRQFALGLYDLGVRQGDRVALHAENSTEWLIVDQAVLRLGAVTVPIYTTQPADQIRYILEDAEARVYVVSTEALFAPLHSYVDEIATLEITVGILGAFQNGMLTFDEVLERGHAETPDGLETLTAAVAPDDLATLVYTSGTTGQPKGVMLTHGNLVFNVLASVERAPFDPETHRGGTLLSYLPLSHIFERMMTLLYLYIGYPIYFVEDFHEIREDFLAVRPIHFSTVPRLLEKIHAGTWTKAETLSGVQKTLMRWALDLAERYDVERTMGRLDRLQYALADRLVFKKIRALFGGNLVGISSGGAALSAALMNFFNALGLFCGQGYGLTETSPVITTFFPGQLRAGSAGTALREVEVHIADDGEILTRGPHVMKGYYKLPDKTAEVLTEEGWFHTGDIGHLDEDGHLFITDRKKELFKLSTGKYVAPSPIEMALGASLFIEQAVVVGSEYKFCSALVVLDAQAIGRHFEEDATVRAGLAAHPSVIALIQQEVDAANEALPHWERIKKFRLLEHPFSIEGGELTPTLKVKRRVVHQKYQREIEAMYE